MAVLPSINQLLKSAMKSKNIIRAVRDSTRVCEGALEIRVVLISGEKKGREEERCW